MPTRDSSIKDFCSYFSRKPWGKCGLLKEHCFQTQSGIPCALKDHYEKLKLRGDEPPLARILKERLWQDVSRNWREYARHPQRRGLAAFNTGKPLEKNIRRLLREELEALNVTVFPPKKIEILGGIGIIPDVTIRKNHRPTTFIMIKTWIGTGGSIREVMMSGHFLKKEFGEKFAKIYAITLIPTFPRGGRLEEVMRDYIDGVYFIDESPYIDDFIRELTQIYQ